MKAANNIARPYRDRLTRLKQAVLASKGEQLRSTLKRALQDVINNNRLVVRLRFPVIGRRTVYQRNIMTPKQLGQLREAIKAIDALPAKSQVKVSAQAAYDRVVDRKAILEQVRSGVESGISENVPEIEWIAAKTEFGVIAPELKVAVGIRFQGKQRPPLELDIYLNDLPRTGLAIATAFDKTL